MTRPLAVAALVVALGACDTTAPEGTYDAQVTGAVTADLSGTASIRETLGLFLSFPPGGIRTNGLGSPAVATYAVAPREESGATTPGTVEILYEYVRPGTAAAETFAGSSGELVVTSVDDESVAGRFSFEATSLTDASRTVTVRGTFDARRQGELD